MGIEVRPIDEAEVGPWVAAMSTGFLHPPVEGDAEHRRSEMDLQRTLGAFDGRQVVGTLRSFPTTLTLPGPTTVPVAALTNVTVSPTHRRRGLLTRMITADLRASAERGEMMSALIASEYPIYGRFGYGPAIEAAGYTVDAALAEFRDNGSGTVELVDRATLRHAAPAIYDQHRKLQPGAIFRSPTWWDRTLRQVPVPGAEPPGGYCALYRSPAGEPEGYLRYRATPAWEQMRPNATLDIDELVALTPAAYQRLWRYCCDVDLVTTVRAGGRPVDEAVTWLLADGRVVRQHARYDFVWLRLLDVPAALTARSYETTGALVLEVTDGLGFARGCFALEASPSGATCAPTTAAPHLTLGVDALGSAYLGGVSVRALAWAGRLSEHVDGAIATADRLLRSTVTPWCSTWF